MFNGKRSKQERLIALVRLVFQKKMEDQKDIISYRRDVAIELSTVLRTWPLVLTDLLSEFVVPDPIVRFDIALDLSKIYCTQFHYGRHVQTNTSSRWLVNRSVHRTGFTVQGHLNTVQVHLDDAIHVISKNWHARWEMGSNTNKFEFLPCYRDHSKCVGVFFGALVGSLVLQNRWIWLFFGSSGPCLICVVFDQTNTTWEMIDTHLPNLHLSCEPVVLSNGSFLVMQKDHYGFSVESSVIEPLYIDSSECHWSCKCVRSSIGQKLRPHTGFERQDKTLALLCTNRIHLYEVYQHAWRKLKRPYTTRSRPSRLEFYSKEWDTIFSRDDAICTFINLGTGETQSSKI